jgi:hypothetical protein
VREPYDVRLDALWRHDSVKAALPREYRIALIAEASRRVRGEAGGGDADQFKVLYLMRGLS